MNNYIYLSIFILSYILFISYIFTQDCKVNPISNTTCFLERPHVSIYDDYSHTAEVKPYIPDGVEILMNGVCYDCL